MKKIQLQLRGRFLLLDISIQPKSQHQHVFLVLNHFKFLQIKNLLWIICFVNSKLENQLLAQHCSTISSRVIQQAGSFFPATQLRDQVQVFSYGKVTGTQPDHEHVNPHATSSNQGDIQVQIVESELLNFGVPLHLTARPECSSEQIEAYSPAGLSNQLNIEVPMIDT